MPRLNQEKRKNVIGAEYSGSDPFCWKCGTRKLNVGIYHFDQEIGKPIYVGQCPKCKCSYSHAFGYPRYVGFWQGFRHTCLACGHDERQQNA